MRYCLKETPGRSFPGGTPDSASLVRLRLQGDSVPLGLTPCQRDVIPLDSRTAAFGGLIIILLED